MNKIPVLRALAEQLIQPATVVKFPRSRPWGLSVPTGLLLLAAGAVQWTTPVASGQVSGLDVGVRTEVVDKPEHTVSGNAPPTPEHSKLYGIFAVLLMRSDEKLVKPVDANLLAALATKELEARGFHQAPKGQKPDILISVLYGRGMLRNPYLADAGDLHGGTESSGYDIGVQQERDQDPSTLHMDGGGTAAVSIMDPTQGLKEKSNGYEQKMQRAGYEKLYLRVTAWQYPTDGNPKPKELWNTTILVDDPEHRDLNTIAGEMLAVGAPYFDKEIKDEEVYVTRPLPDGKVNVGTPEVIEPASARTR